MCFSTTPSTLRDSVFRARRSDNRAMSARATTISAPSAMMEAMHVMPQIASVPIAPQFFGEMDPIAPRPKQIRMSHTMAPSSLLVRRRAITSSVSRKQRDRRLGCNQPVCTPSADTSLPAPQSSCACWLKAYPKALSVHRRAAIPARNRFHDLRATHETLLLDAGVGVHVVAARCGHDPSGLLRAYANPTKQPDTSAPSVTALL